MPTPRLAQARMRLIGGRALLEWTLVGLATSAVVLWLSLTAALQRPDNILYDAFTRLRAGAPSDEIVVVAIDNDSLAALGRWPWPRALHAQMLDRLAAAKPAAIAYDVLFTEASGGDDAVLAAAIRRAATVCLPTAVDPAGADGAMARTLEPLPALRAAAFGTGQVNLTADADGVARRAPLYLHAGIQTWPHLAACLLRAGGRPDKGPPSQAPPPTSDVTSQSLLIDYRGRAGHFRTAPFVSVLRGEVPAALLRDKLVLVGMTADGQGDRYATPRSGVGQLIPGVEIQAALVDTLLRRAAIVAAPPWLIAVLSLATVWTLMLGFLVLPPRWTLALAAGLGVVLLVGAAAAFALGYWLAPGAGLIGLVLAFPLWSWRRLASASAYMQAELEAFVVEDSIAPNTGRGAGDVVARQVAAMQSALATFRTAQRHRAEALQFLSHDMRAPQVSTLALLRGAHDRGDPAFEQRLADNAQLTLQLAESYVQLARAESQDLQLSLFDTAQALIDAADTLWPQADARGLRLVTPTDPSEMLVRGDRPLMTRAFMNLIDNAIKFSPPGGEVVCTLHAAPDAQPPRWRIAIRDQGPGMTQAAFERLQKPFERDHPEGTGLGLGLAFVATVIKRHGGAFALRADGGAVFDVLLDVAADEP